MAKAKQAPVAVVAAATVVTATIAAVNIPERTITVGEMQGEAFLDEVVESVLRARGPDGELRAGVPRVDGIDGDVFTLADVPASWCAGDVVEFGGAAEA